MTVVCLSVLVQAKLMSECSSSIDSVNRVKLMLNDEEELDKPGVNSGVADKQTAAGTSDPGNTCWGKTPGLL